MTQRILRWIMVRYDSPLTNALTGFRGGAMEPKMRVLIGYDGSNVTEEVIKDLKWAGLPKNVSATVLSAADVFMPPVPDASTPSAARPAIKKARDAGQKALRLAQSLSEHGAQQLKKAFPDWKVFSESIADSPAWALVKKAENWDADLIVVGAHGHSRIGRFIGSVSQMVLVHAAQSVRISRSHSESKNGKPRILVGVDGSAGAQAAIDTVAKRAWQPGTEVFLLGVIELKTSMLMTHMTPSEIRWILDYDTQERVALRKKLESCAKTLRDKGLILTCGVEVGDPKRILVERAKTWRAGSIFLGARGLGNLKRFLIGGVSAAVSARADCSVEVVR